MLLLLLACTQKPIPVDTAHDDTAREDTDTDVVDTGPFDADGDGTSDEEDCDDADASVHPGAEEFCNGADDNCDGNVDEGAGSTWYSDADNDGWGDDSTAMLACAAAAGQVAVAGDCADTDPSRHPGAAETDCTDPVDYNCDGSASYADADADGFAACDDCDDAVAATHSGATETCNGVDDDCDGAGDDDAADLDTFYEDDDGDSFGDAADPVLACTQTAGLVTDATDCDDRDAGVYPGATEVCDDEDDDCDGSVDDDATDATTWYADTDGDGYGDDATATTACDAPSRYASVGGDCDEADAARNPGETEICNDVDDDCDGDVDGTAVDMDTWYADADDDGYGDPSVYVAACDAPVASIRNSRDCDDGDATSRPYAWEDTADGSDHDCDGAVDTADVDVVNDETLALSDDTGVLVSPASFFFPLCGNTFSTLYLESNGRVVFGATDTDYTETAAEFAADASVAVLWDDLDPRYYSPTVAWVEHDDAIAFFWRDITEYNAENASTAELVIFDDGRSMLAWGDVDVLDGLAGFSCATATSYSASDFAAEAPDDGRWGLGDGTADIVYELWDGSSTMFDLANSSVRLCGNAGSGDPCADD